MKVPLKYALGILISIIIIFQFSLYSQQNKRARRAADDPVGAIKMQLTAAVKTQFGQDYRCAFSVLDSAIARNESTNDDGELTDSYGTLKSFILFGADKKPVDDMEHGIMGIYKDGQIIWHSDPIFKGAWGGIFSIKDINKDGKVDLLIEWTPGDMQMIMVRHLWIISWDGTTGTIINQIDPTSGNTTIHGAESLFELIAMDTISPMQIRAYWPDEEDFSKWFPNTPVSTYPYVTYSWNGTQYGLWSSTRQIPAEANLPANLLKTPVSCSLMKQNDSLLYHYVIDNAQTSHQSLLVFALKGLRSGFVNTIQNGWDFLGYSPSYSLAQWTTHLREKEGSILPGSELILDIECKGLPSIVSYYTQGMRSLPDINPLHTSPSLANDFLSDLFKNSFHNFTVGPSDPLSPFVLLNFLDTLTNYTTQSRSLGWIKDQTIANKYLVYFSSARTKLVQHDSVGARTVLQQVLKDVNIDSTTNISSEAYALLRFNTEYLVNILPQAQAAPFCAVKLVSSTGTKLTGGALQYYEGNWKDAVNNNDGTFSVNTTAKTLSLRMTYEYGTQTKSNVIVGYDTVVFQTVNAQIQLQNSSGAFIDTGSVQYYAGAWRTLGTTTNGIAAKELLPANYSFRMTYAYASKDKQQDIGTNATVVFQTVNAAVQLKNSLGNLIDQGTVQYYSGAWRELGTTTNGVANKELLPNNYSFRMAYAYASKDKQQDISTNPTVVFQTVNATVQLQNSQGTLIDQGTVQYYSGAWRDLGVTTNGIVAKELLPNNYSFRMTYAYASKDKQQDISTNPTVVFQTVNAAVQLQNSQGTLIDQGTVQYYSGAWRDLGTTTSGIAKKELLPNNYSFRMTYEYVSLDKAQDISTNNTVSFSTVLCTIRVKNSQNQLINNAMTSYYSGAWRQIGNTVNGVITKELLPVNLSFRVKYGTQQQDKQQNLSTNTVVEFGIQ